MRVRDTARVLLMDGDGRLLLMRGRLAGAPDAARFWFTVGGGVEPGETLVEAAQREILEETGIGAARLGPIVWRREAVVPHMSTHEPMLFRESYLVALCDGQAPDRSGWNELEQQLVDAIRWWTLGEIVASVETIYPEGLADLLPEILAGQYPSPPRWIGPPSGSA